MNSNELTFADVAWTINEDAKRPSRRRVYTEQDLREAREEEARVEAMFAQFDR